MKNTLAFDILKYFATNYDDAISITKFKKHLKDLGYHWPKFNDKGVVEEDQENFREFASAFNNFFKHPTSVLQEDENSFWFKEGVIFNLLEYIELHEAREQSKEARQWSLNALVLSLITLAASCWFSFQEIELTKKPVNIKQPIKVTVESFAN